MPPDIEQAITQLIQQEGQRVQQTMGQPPKPSDLQERKRNLLEQAEDAARRKATAWRWIPQVRRAAADRLPASTICANRRRSLISSGIDSVHLST